jgi:hypothetical protein
MIRRPLHASNPISTLLENRMKHSFYFSRRSSLAAALVVMAAVSACSDDTGPKGGGTPAAVEVAVAPAASSQVATAIPGPSVVVKDASGSPVAGVVVKFEVAGGGAVQFPVATTDADGIASTGLWQIGPKVGANVITATVGGLSPVTFTVASTAGPAAAIGPFSGGGQSGSPGAPLAQPLVARVTDAGGNPKPGVVVTFAVTAGGGSLSTTTGTTNANGLATSGTWTLGTGQCGQTVRATAGSLVVDFSASSRGTISIGGSASGTLGTGDCVFDGRFADEYGLTTAGDAITVTMTGTANPLAQVVTADGSALVASAPSFRLITASGSKAVRATTANAGETGAYTISVASASSAVTDCSATYLEIGASTTQTLSSGDCTADVDVAGDPYLVYVPAGITVRVSQTAVPLDAELFVFRPDGSLLADRDNGGVGASGTEVVTFTASVSGFYKIVPSSYCLVFDDVYRANCDYGAYTLSVVKP